MYKTLPKLKIQLKFNIKLRRDTVLFPMTVRTLYATQKIESHFVLALFQSEQFMLIQCMIQTIYTDIMVIRRVLAQASY